MDMEHVYDTTRTWQYGKVLNSRIRGHGDMTTYVCIRASVYNTHQCK